MSTQTRTTGYERFEVVVTDERTAKRASLSVPGYTLWSEIAAEAIDRLGDAVGSAPSLCNARLMDARTGSAMDLDVSIGEAAMGIAGGFSVALTTSA